MSQPRIVFNGDNFLVTAFNGIWKRIAAIFSTRRESALQLTWEEWQRATPEMLRKQSVYLCLPSEIGFAQRFDARTKNSGLKRKVLKQNLDRLLPSCDDATLVLVNDSLERQQELGVLALSKSSFDLEQLKSVRRLSFIPERYPDWAFVSLTSRVKTIRQRQFALVSILCFVAGVSMTLNGLADRAERQNTYIRAEEKKLRSEAMRLAEERSRVTLLEQLDESGVGTSLLQARLNMFLKISNALPAGSAISNYSLAMDGKITITGRSDSVPKLVQSLSTELPEFEIDLHRSSESSEDGLLTFSLEIDRK